MQALYYSNRGDIKDDALIEGHQLRQVSLSQVVIPAIHTVSESAYIQLRVLRLTRPTRSSRVEEKIYRTFTVGLSHFVHQSSLILD